MSVSHEEVLGLINGLALSVHEQHRSNKEQHAATAQHLEKLSEVVEELAQNANVPRTGATLRLPNLTLPEFTGREPLDRFLDQISQVLKSSGVPPKFWVAYLKQQCCKDARSYDLLCTYEQTRKVLSADAPSSEHEKFFNSCLELLAQRRGIPKEQQICQLLSTYYMMTQGPNESVADFAHRFCETQHALEKLIPNIHRTADGGDIELIHAFAIKLLPAISKEILSRDFNFPDLPSVIEAAKRTASRIPPNFAESGWKQPQVNAMMHQANTRNTRRRNRNETEQSGDRFCFVYNKYHNASCEQSGNPNICKKGFLHKCSVCNKFNCKAVRHSDPPSQRSVSRPSPAVNVNVAEPPNVSSSHNVSDSLLKSLNDSISSFNSRLDSIEHRLPAPNPPTSSTDISHDQIFGMPAVTAIPSSLEISKLGLAKKNILWTKVSSVGISLPLPLDSCCSVSLVSQAHADAVQNASPHLKFTRLQQPH